MAKLLKTYIDFRGGLNTDSAPDNLADNELMEVYNADLDERGAISKRKGTAPLMHSGTCPDQTGMTNVQIKLASTASSTNDKYNSRILLITGGTGAGQKRIISDYDGTNRIATVDMAWITQPDSTSTYEVIVNYGVQVEDIIKWARKDGTTVKLAVIGTTLCKIDDDGSKTDIKVLSDKNIGWFVHNDKFYFTGKESGTDKYWVYDGNAVVEVAANSASDNDLGPIKRCRKFVWHPKSMRVFAAGDPQDKACLYYSEANDPTYFKNTSKMYPTTADGAINELTLFGSAMLTIFQVGSWAWKGSNPATDATWERLPLSQGAVAGKTAALTPNTLTFLGIGGLYSLSLSVLDYNIIMLTGDEIVKNLAKDKVTSIIRSIVHPETACAIYDQYNERYILAYGDDVSNPRNNKLLVLDWGLKAFVVYTGLQVNCMCQLDNGDVLLGTNGYILKLGTGYKDWDTANGNYKPIFWQITTKYYNLDMPFNFKKFKKLFIAARQYGLEKSSIDIKVQYDYKYFELSAISLDESFVWGEIWGNLWGWSELITKEAKLTGKGTRAQVIFKNAAMDEQVTIYGIAFLFKPKKPKGEKVN